MSSTLRRLARRNVAVIFALDTPRGPVRVGRGREQLEGVRRVQISEGLHRCRKELPQHPTQAQHVPGPVRSQTRLWWLRATNLIASLSSQSPATGR